MEAQERVLRPALLGSLFPNMPPTIYFGTCDERGKEGGQLESRL